VDISQEIMEMGFRGYHCSQILMKLALAYRESENTELIRAMSALNGGMGFSGSTCGVLTASCCVFGLFAGKGADDEIQKSNLDEMINAFIEWFTEFTDADSTSCTDIRTINGGNCSDLIAASHVKTMEILSEGEVLEI
jgi:hypothetical protein